MAADPKKSGTKKADPESTARHVFKKLVIPKALVEKIPETDILRTQADGSLIVWCPVVVDGKPEMMQTFNGTKRGAIEAFTGEGDAALIGEWKAPSKSAWNGGRRHVLPAQPRMEFGELD